MLTATYNLSTQLESARESVCVGGQIESAHPLRGIGIPMCQYLIKCVGHGGGEFDEVFLFEIFFVWLNKDKGKRQKAQG